MDSQTKQAIQHAMNNNPAGMSEVIRDIIAGKVEVAIESRKQEIAQSLLQPQVEEYEIDEEIVKKLNLEAFSLDVLEDYILSEEFEQLDELSKKTLSNYVKKASRSVRTNTSMAKDFERDADHHLAKADKHNWNGPHGSYQPKDTEHSRKEKAASTLSKMFNKDAKKRIKGISMAADKLSK